MIITAMKPKLFLVALAFLLGAAVVAVAPPSHAASAVESGDSDRHGFRALTDINAEADALDNASYKIARSLVRSGPKQGDRTIIKVKLKGIEAPLGTAFKSHVHVGACVAGDADGTGAHYKDDVHVPEAVESNEVWFSFSTNEKGRAKDRTKSFFVIREGDAKSIVIHDGTTGAKLACLPFTPPA